MKQNLETIAITSTKASTQVRAARYLAEILEADFRKTKWRSGAGENLGIIRRLADSPGRKIFVMDDTVFADERIREELRQKAVVIWLNRATEDLSDEVAGEAAKPFPALRDDVSLTRAAAMRAAHLIAAGQHEALDTARMLRWHLIWYWENRERIVEKRYPA